jgi:hypothetical protein
MSRLKARVFRLEAAAGLGKPGQRTFEKFVDDHLALDRWLEEKGYADHLAAIEAAETGPAGLEDILREQAASDPARRAWARMQKFLRGEGERPSAADMDLLKVKRP